MSQKLRADIKSDIDNRIIKNGQGGITAPILNAILTDLADSAYIKGDDVITGGSEGGGSGPAMSTIGTSLVTAETASAILDLLLDPLPTTEPTTSGTWWNNAGFPVRTL